MLIRFSFTLSGLLFLVVLQGCGPDFKTDFDPPPANVEIMDVFPDEINGMKGVIKKANLTTPLVGFSSIYGEGEIAISIIQTESNAAADEYFEFGVVPNFDKMKTHFRGNINGKWRASGTDEKGRKWFGWVNNNWVFLINGINTKYFKMAIDAFEYVEE